MARIPSLRPGSNVEAYRTARGRDAADCIARRHARRGDRRRSPGMRSRAHRERRERLAARLPRDLHRSKDALPRQPTATHQRRRPCSTRRSTRGLVTGREHRLVGHPRSRGQQRRRRACSSPKARSAGPGRGRSSSMTRSSSSSWPGSSADAFPGRRPYRPDASTIGDRARVLSAPRRRAILHVGLGDPDEYGHRNDYPALPRRDRQGRCVHRTARGHARRAWASSARARPSS